VLINFLLEQSLDAYYMKIFINIVNCVVSAGTCFKAAKCYDKASNAFKKAADAHYSSHAYPKLLIPPKNSWVLVLQCSLSCRSEQQLVF